MPSLLLQQPNQPLSDLNLQSYTVLDCEPLHDLKGHLHNLFDEIMPLLQNPSVISECQKVLETTVKKEKAKGSDYRLAAVLLLCLLKHKEQGNIVKLMQTIVEIGEIMYSSDAKRTCKQVLRLFNLTWLHAELCVDTVFQPTSMTHRKTFGIYYHTITCHAAQQYQLVCLKSTNAKTKSGCLDRLIQSLETPLM